MFQPYYPISQMPDETLQHGARESISISWVHDSLSSLGKIRYDSSTPFSLLILSAVLVVVDPKREHFITKKEYRVWVAEFMQSSFVTRCFLKEVDGYTKARFFKELNNCEGQMPMDNLVHRLQNIIARVMVTNATEVLTSLHDALDKIDLSLSQDDILRWRERFGL